MMVERVTGEVSTSDLSDLVDVLIDCIADGASLGWPGVPPRTEIDAWWRSTLADPLVETWISRSNAGRILGTVSLQLVDRASARHRAEVMTLVVHRDARGRGIAKDLMIVLEAYARADGRSLLLLDTETGSLAESLYQKWGWKRLAEIDGYALSADGSLAPATVMVKRFADPDTRIPSPSPESMWVADAQGRQIDVTGAAERYVRIRRKAAQANRRWIVSGLQSDLNKRNDYLMRSVEVLNTVHDILGTGGGKRFVAAVERTFDPVNFWEER